MYYDLDFSLINLTYLLTKDPDCMAFLIRIPDARKYTNSQFRIKNSLIGSRLIRINIKMDPEKLF